MSIQSKLDSTALTLRARCPTLQFLKFLYFLCTQKPVMCLCWSPDGRYLTSGDVDGIILIWDIQQKVMVGRLDNHTGCVHALVFSRDGEVLASGK